MGFDWSRPAVRQRISVASWASCRGHLGLPGLGPRGPLRPLSGSLWRLVLLGPRVPSLKGPCDCWGLCRITYATPGFFQ
eukprot:7178548-Pyramimonas_sp.AAC.1